MFLCIFFFFLFCYFLCYLWCGVLGVVGEELVGRMLGRSPEDPQKWFGRLYLL